MLRMGADGSLSTYPVGVRGRFQLLPPWLAPALLTLLGAWLRFYHLTDVYANLDHAYPLAQAIRWLQLGHWPLLGQGTSVLVANPPGMAYLMAVPWLLFGSEWGAACFAAALNLLAVPLTYQAARHAAGRPAGLAAMALVAANPWVVFFSRGTWVQGLLPFWTALTFTLLLRALFRRGRPVSGGRLWAALLALTGLTQMYLLALLSLAPVGLILAINWRRLPRRALALGGAGLLLASGWFGLQLARDWPNQAPKLAGFFENSQPAQLDATAFNHALRLVSGADFEVENGNDGSPAWPVRRLLSQVLAAALSGILLLGVLRAVWRVAVARPDAGLWLAVLIWWAAPIAALSISAHPVNIAYLLLSLPAGFVLAGPILAPLARSRLALPALAAVTGLWFALIVAGTQQVAAQPAARSLDELSIGAALRLRPVVRALVADDPQAEFYTPLDSASLSAKAGAWLPTVTWTPLPDVVQFRVGHAAIYMRLEPGGRPEPPRLAQPVAEVDYPGDERLSFDRIQPYSRAELNALPQHPVGWPSAQGLTLVGYDLAPDQRELWVYWTVDTLDDARGQWLYAPYAHVVDGAGRLAANAGAPGLPGYYYRAGDVFLSRLSLPALPPGHYFLDLGMYDGLHGLSLNLRSPDGAATDHYRAELVVP